MSALIKGKLTAAAYKMISRPLAGFDVFGESTEEFCRLSRGFWDDLAIPGEFWREGDIVVPRMSTAIASMKVSRTCYGIRFDRVGVAIIADHHKIRR
ncbi:MAG TPA: hypothetical protein VGH86_13385, partial [Phenylobacterium sp.]